jgi:hypothetical protein
MSTQVQLRRGSTVDISTRTPANGELWVNTDNYSLHVGDGVTVGGIILPSLGELPDTVTTDTVYFADFTPHIIDDGIGLLSGQATTALGRINFLRHGNNVSMSGYVTLSGYPATTVPLAENAFLQINLATLIAGRGWFTNVDETVVDYDTPSYGVHQRSGGTVPVAYGEGSYAELATGNELHIGSSAIITIDGADTDITTIQHVFDVDMVVSG